VSESLPGPDAVPAAFTLAELTAMVVISGYNPNFINPESFRQNGIVDGDWSLETPAETPAVVGGSQTSFHYTNGVTVWANPDYLVVTQKGDSLQVSEFRGHQVVSRYVEIAPANVFHAVGFNLEGNIRLPDGAGLSSPLDQRLTLGDTQPALEMRASYEQEGKELALFWTEHLRPSNQEDPHLSLRGIIRLPVPEASKERESQQVFVKDVLAHRERHLRKFWSLIQQLADLYQLRGT